MEIDLWKVEIKHRYYIHHEICRRALKWFETVKKEKMYEVCNELPLSSLMIYYKLAEWTVKGEHESAEDIISYMYPLTKDERFLKIASDIRFSYPRLRIMKRSVIFEQSVLDFLYRAWKGEVYHKKNENAEDVIDKFVERLVEIFDLSVKEWDNMSGLPFDKYGPFGFICERTSKYLFLKTVPGHRAYIMGIYLIAMYMNRLLSLFKHKNTLCPSASSFTDKVEDTLIKAVRHALLSLRYIEMLSKEDSAHQYNPLYKEHIISLKYEKPKEDLESRIKGILWMCEVCLSSPNIEDFPSHIMTLCERTYSLYIDYYNLTCIEGYSSSPARLWENNERK